MLTGRCARQSGPYLLEPLLIVLSRNDAEHPRSDRWTSIPTVLPQHQNELNVVLNHSVGLKISRQHIAPLSGLVFARTPATRAHARISRLILFFQRQWPLCERQAASAHARIASK